jgi:DNA-binding response OmpR family regulator
MAQDLARPGGRMRSESARGLTPLRQPVGDVLCIDDDPVLQVMLAEVVRLAGATHHEARSAREVAALLGRRAFDLILLDRRLPDTDGLLLIEIIRRRESCPIIVLSELGCPHDRQLGLGLGAHDYLSKPFNPTELSSRIRVLLGRERSARERRRNETIICGRLAFNPGSRRLRIDEEVSFLPPAETRMLCFLLERRGEVLSRDALMAAACGRDWSPGDRTADVLIARLRKKIPRDVAEIVTVHRLGYVLHPS